MSAPLLTQFSARYYPASLPNTRGLSKALALLALAVPVVSSAGTYTVTSNADTGTTGTLRWAIIQANADAGSTITFSAGLSPVVLSSALPIITTAVTINGGAGTTISGNNQHRVFFVNTASATDAVNFQNLTIANGYAKGGDGGVAAGGGLGAGGAIFVNKGAVSIAGVALSGNAARGGNGGISYSRFSGRSAGSGGGGGGLGGNGGKGNHGGGGSGGFIGSGGGGGGGYQGNGGNSMWYNSGGGGGGGILGDGGNSSDSFGGGGGGTTNGGAPTAGTSGGAGGGPSGNNFGTAGTVGGGGGGATGAWYFNGADPKGGAGGTYGGGGGGSIRNGEYGDSSTGAGGAGGDFGGGGGVSSEGYNGFDGARGGAGGFGGGGGAGSARWSFSLGGIPGGLGGFGGGGGGSADLEAAPGGAYGGSGGYGPPTTEGFGPAGSAGGGGGAALGGAIFVRSENGASLQIQTLTESGSTATAGLAGSYLPESESAIVIAATAGQALGSGIFLPKGDSNIHGGTIGGEIAGVSGAVLRKVGGGTLTILGTSKSHTHIISGAVSIGNGGTAGSLAGNVANDASLIFNRSDALSYDGSVSGIGSLIKLGDGTLTLTGSNSFIGVTSVGAGILALSGAGDSSRIFNTTIAAGGTLRLLDSNQIGTSVVTVDGGTFDFNGKTDYFAWLIMKNGGTVGGGGKFTLESVGSPLLSATGGGNAGTIATTFGITSQHGIGGDADRTVQINAAAATSLTISGAIRDTLEGATHVGSLNKTGTGTLVLSGENTYTGTTSVNGGILRFASPSAFYTGNINPATAGRLAVASGATAAFNVGGTGEFSAIHLDTLRASGGFASGGSPGFDTTNASGGAFTYASHIDGSIGIAKLGTGTLVLTGSNSFTGPVTVSGGTLSLGSAGAIGTSGTISFGGGTLQYTASNAADYSSRFSTAAGQQYRIDTNGRSVTLASALTSSGGTFEKLGTGTATLSTGSTYTGTTTVSAGTLAVGSTSLSSSFAIASGAVLELNSTSVDRDMLGISTFSGTGTLRKTGAGGVYWGASAATFAMGSGGLIEVQGGVIYAGSFANDVWTGNLADLNLAPGARFQGGEANVRVDALSGSGLIGTGSGHPSYQSFTFGVDNGSGTFSGVLADDASHSGNFTKAGTGTQILSGANTYTGTTVIHNGTLAFTGTMTGNGALTVGSGGTLAGTSTLPMPVTVQSGGTIAPGHNGAGTLTLSGVVSLNGGCKLNFDLGTLSDKLALNGSYTPPAGGTVVVNVAALAGFGDGTYPLITGAAGISAGSFSLGAMPPGDTYSLTAAAGTLSLIVGPLSVPSGLAAVAGTAQVSLTWSPAENATGYNLKRSTQAGGPYAVIAANVPGPGHADSGLTNGTRYYYVVSALYSGAESPDSSEASAMPLAPLDPAELLAPTLVRDGNLMHLSTASSSLGRSYQLQRSLTLEGSSWENIGEAIPGTGAGLTFDDSPPAEADRCFFRIVILP